MAPTVHESTSANPSLDHLAGGADGPPADVTTVARRLVAMIMGDRGLASRDALAAAVDEAKRLDLIDPSLATDSMVLFCEVLGRGAHVLQYASAARAGAELSDALHELMERFLRARLTQDPRS